jgi:hypothetical protein
MLFFLLALVTAAIGALPFFLVKKFGFGAKSFAIYALIFWCIFYISCPSMVYPLGGWIGGMAVVAALFSAIICFVVEDRGDWDGPIVQFSVPLIGGILFAIVAFSGCGAFRATEYAALLGPMENRTWTQDIQPADPGKIRQVSPELAMFLADKQLGEAESSLGSQFSIARDHVAIQRINGELWYIIPLDFNSFNVWTSAKSTPGYIMVHGDDPTVLPVLKVDQNFNYTPGAFFGKDLERHLWRNGFATKGLTDYTLEVDEEGKAWWVVTVFETTIAFWGEQIVGVAKVDPVTGDIVFWKNDEVESWVDRVTPGDTLKSWIDDWGMYTGGWINTWWNKKNLMQAGTPEIVYGSDGEPYFETDVTSLSAVDQSLVGIIYTNSRTGKSVFYKASGGTDEAILTVVNAQVKYKNWHGASPVLYNLYGVMTLVVPTLGERHNFTGIALARVDNQQVAVGETLPEALREYQKLLAGAGDKVAFEKTHGSQTIEGRVSRFASDTSESGTVYYLLLEGTPHLFTGGTVELSPKLPVTNVGDWVTITYVPSGEDVEPMSSFDNTSIQLVATELQDAVRAESEEHRAAEADRRDASDVRTAIGEMSDAELLERMGRPKQDGSK